MEHIEMEPGQLFLKEEEIICNAGRTTSKISVTNIRRPSCPNRVTFSLL